MLSSSPHLSSAPASPVATFQNLRKSPYHAARRRPSSTCAPPRPQVSSGPSAAQSQPSPALSFAPSPRLINSPRQTPATRKYADAATQYSPDGYPPTYRPHPPAAPAAPSTQLSQPTVPIERGVTSAEVTITEPPEPVLRVDPQPAVSAQKTQPHAATSRDKGEAPARVLQTPRQDEADAAPAEQSSPAKRARPQSGNLKVMPLKYETCDVKDLGVLISDMLMELVRLNDDMPLRDGHLTRFHSRAPPAISVKDYLFRLIVHATLSPPILLSMVFYVDKLCSMYPAFTISSLTVHRFLITAATVAAKGLSDSFWTNSLYAKVGGVSLRELALLELEFLRKLDWRIVPKPEVLVDYYKGLVDRGDGYIMERETDSEVSSTPESSAVSSRIDALVASTTGSSGS
ncbi:cyclin-domain-containing protein [Karstenula rhodostoma CBS 690.94]|uniref:Cyclin-domain-containing protein n=1 Tax=Karstenula rhodostoma CBS 690.94 TaxID=1392251 RepID=A0A9P4PIB5_9PLEO|nr:cyclin-domain-containing protein [Karstenula rhodostoma CBS 690.94]